MREQIRKILKEETDLERIQKNEISVPRMVPRIVSFIKEKYGKKVRVESHNKGVYFGSDDYRGLCKEIKIFVEDERLLPAEVKIELWRDIKNFFGINMSEYGSCLDLTVYKKIWSKV